MKKKELLIGLLIIIILAGSIYILLQPIIFFVCLVTDDGGKLNNFENISEYVLDEQSLLEDISCQMLSQGNNISVYKTR